MGKILLAQTCPSPAAPILFSRLQPPPHLWDPAQRLAGGQAFPGSSWGALNAGGGGVSSPHPKAGSIRGCCSAEMDGGGEEWTSQQGEVLRKHSWLQAR